MAREAMTVDAVLAEAAGSLRAVGAADALGEQMARLTAQLVQLQGAAAETVQAKTRAADPSVAEKVVDVTGGAISTSVLGATALGMGLSPLVGAIARLFGGGGEKQPPPLIEFAMPEPVQLSAGVSARVPGGPFAVDYAQGGAPRPVMAPTQVTVQVQAMDSRSFLDHSNDIALAVRQAMLESSVLNDVIREA